MWRHSSIADARPEQPSSSAPEPWSLGEILPPWWNGLPFVAVIAGSLGPALAIAGVWYYSSPRYTDVDCRPVQPVPCSLKLHLVELGLDYRYCHAPVEILSPAVPRSSWGRQAHSVAARQRSTASFHRLRARALAQAAGAAGAPARTD